MNIKQDENFHEKSKDEGIQSEINEMEQYEFDLESKNRYHKSL